jgi:glyoxylase-like metal-dependent hydrolase (beta-lactamase superfamily II)
MNFYDVKKIYPWLYSIYDPLGSYCYLVIGGEKALLFDTGHGIAPLREAINAITDKPVITVLSHGHVDHVNGAYQFDEVWLHEFDFDLFREHTSVELRMNIPCWVDKKIMPKNFNYDAYVNAATDNLRKLNVGHVFNLGGLNIEVIGTEGHTAGSIGLLAREHRVLLNGDSANSHVWMFLPNSLPVSQYIAMLERILELGFDTFYTGHSNEPLPKSELYKYIHVARNASFEKAEPYEAFSTFYGFLYQENDVGIVFNEKTLDLSCN